MAPPSINTGCRVEDSQIYLKDVAARRCRASLVRQGFGPPDSAIMKPGAHHLFRRVDIAQVHNDRTCHDLGHLLEIERAKLLPLCHDHERVRPFRTIIGIVAEGDVLKNLPGLRHADGIEGANLRAHIL